MGVRTESIDEGRRGALTVRRDSLLMLQLLKFRDVEGSASVALVLR